jgi:hypothetical protein
MWESQQTGLIAKGYGESELRLLVRFKLLMKLFKRIEGQSLLL